MMKILYIDGFQTEKAGVDIVQALRDMGHDVQTYSDEPMIVTVLHETVVQELKDYIRAHEVELLVSIHFIMCAELAAWQMGIPYISVLWDAPYTEIYNPLGRMGF